MRKIFFILSLLFLTSCFEGGEKNNSSNAINIPTRNIDSIAIDSIMKQQKFDIAKIKVDSILSLKPLGQREYYYYQKGFVCLMLQDHKEAISNFEQAIALGYEIKASMIETAKKMQKTYNEYNKEDCYII